MAELRRVYRVTDPGPDELNRVLADISDRLDQMEGFRDTPAFKSNIDMGGNKGTNAAEGTANADVAIKGQLESSYPVGAIFIAVVSTNPSTLLGFGTWSAFGAGKVLVGIDPLDTDFDTVKETGGAKTHTHTTPAHQHPDGEVVDNDGAASTVAVNDASGGSGTTGSGSSMPPYISVYMWERTA